MNRLPYFVATFGRPVGVLVLALVAGGVFVYWTGQRASVAHLGFEQASQARDQARDRLERVDDEKRTLERYGPAYRLLAEQGIIGAEQRVNWLDGLRLASQATRGFGVDYEVSGQQAALLKLDAGDYEARQSEMKLRLRLLHEGDLLAFLDALGEQRAGLYFLQACGLKPSGNGAFTARFEPKLLAECKLTWVTLDDRTLRGAP